MMSPICDAVVIAVVIFLGEFDGDVCSLFGIFGPSSLQISFLFVLLSELMS